MTKKETPSLSPDLIQGSRKRRIAAGSGTEIQDVNRLLKQFYQMQKMSWVKRFSKLIVRVNSYKGYKISTPDKPFPNG